MGIADKLLAPLLVCAALAPGCASDPIAVEEDRRIEGSKVLIDALASGDDAVRARAALAMGRVQSPSYTAPLVAAAAAESDEVRHAALFAMGQLALAEGSRLPRSLYAALARVMAGSPDDETLALALEALGKLGEPVQAHRIHPFLRHESARVRTEAALALFRCRFVPVLRDGLADAPVLPEPAVRSLIATFADPVAEVRRAAVYACSRYGEPLAVAPLVERLADDDEWVRLFAARALGRSGDPTARGELLPLLSDPSERVRTEALAAVAALGGADDLPPALAGDESFHVRAALAAALAGGGPPSLEALRGLVRDPAVMVRAAAIEALAARPGGASPDELRQWFGGDERPVRLAALRAAAAPGAEGRRLIDAALADEDPAIRAAGLEALGAIGEGAAPAVVEALQSDDLAIRGTAVEVFGEAGAPDRVEQLRAVYDGSPGDEWIEVRRAVVSAVADVRQGRPVIWNAARADPARAVRDEAEAILRRFDRSPPRTQLEPRKASRFLGQRFDEDPVVQLETTQGTLRIRLFADAAPVHVASFVSLVRKGYYDGLTWHRVVSNFVVQGGDPRGDGWGGPGYLLRDEINRVRFDRGTLGMPKAGRDTGGGQIFITHLPTPHLDGSYTAFGQVIEGLEVVDRLQVSDRILKARLE